MTTARRLGLACLLGTAVLLTACSGPTADPKPKAPAEAADAAAGPATAAGTAEDAARAACAEIDALVIGGSRLGHVQDQERGVTAAAAHLRAAAEADESYRDEAEALEEMVVAAADALALVEEHGDDVASWDTDAQQAWGTAGMGVADGLVVMFELCNIVDPPDGSPSDG